MRDLAHVYSGASMVQVRPVLAALPGLRAVGQHGIVLAARYKRRRPGSIRSVKRSHLTGGCGNTVCTF
jgi:hypothetical protein